jgi:methyl-accepting chemotaxis protein
MSAEQSDKLDEVAAGLDDLKTTVEELAEDPPQGTDSKTIEKLNRRIEKARDTADDLEDQTE